MSGLLGTTQSDFPALDEPRNLSEWDEEELRFGRRRDASGGLRGKRPKVIPVACANELIRRRTQHALVLLHDEVEPVLAELVAIARGQKKANRDQLKAIQDVLDRSLGRAIERQQVELSQDKPWALDVRALVMGAAADVSNLDTPQPEVIDAQVVEAGHDTSEPPNALTEPTHEDDEPLYADDDPDVPDWWHEVAAEDAARAREREEGERALEQARRKPRQQGGTVVRQGFGDAYSSWRAK